MIVPEGKGAAAMRVLPLGALALDVLVPQLVVAVADRAGRVEVRVLAVPVFGIGAAALARPLLQQRQ